MTFSRIVVLMSGLVFAACGGTAQAQAPAAGKMVTLQMPALPDPVKVTLKPATTALVVFDIVEPICKSQPKCMSQMLPAAIPFMAQARKAGVLVAYGTRAPNASKWMPEIAPKPGDIQITSTAQDRFFNTDLDKQLKAKGITTLILIGWKSSGSVAYTSVGATLHDYTVVVPMDTTAATTDYETTIGFYNILNQNSANLANEPLKPKASTLSRTDMIAFQ
jgi:nicotinamidase-related amidase